MEQIILPNEKQKAAIQEGKRRYGVIENDDFPPTESDQRKKHAEQHKGKFMECKTCEKEVSG